jgi:hypothetical protein
LRRRDVNAEEQLRLSKLEGLAETLKRGKNVQNRQLKRWLTVQEYEQIELEWDTQKYLRTELNDKPDELKRYEVKLKEAVMIDNRASAYHRKGNKSAAYKCDAKRERLCEEALEVLQEIVFEDASLQIWFDRALDFGHGSLIDSSLGNLPRLVTSRSIDKQGNDSRIVKKIDVKISVVERAIDALKNDDADVGINGKETTRKQLDEFLKLDDI